MNNDFLKSWLNNAHPSNIPDRKKNACVYILECRGLYKIGRTNNLEERLKSLQTSNPFDIQVMHLIFTRDTVQVEEALHLIFAGNRTQGEWFNLGLRGVAQIKSMSVQDILDLGAQLKPKPEEGKPYIDPDQMGFDW